MRAGVDRSCRENQNAHFMFSNFFLFWKSHRLWDNVEKWGKARGVRNDVTIWRMRVTCCTSKATCTHAQTHTHIQVCHIYCFSTATMICERTSVLCYTYIACLVLRIHVFASLKINRREYISLDNYSNDVSRRKCKILIAWKLNFYEAKWMLLFLMFNFLP
jgi:hypothetical protein